MSFMGKVKKNVVGLNDQNEIEDKAVKLVDEDGHMEILEMTPKMIQSDISVAVETPFTTSVLREVGKHEARALLEDISMLNQFPSGQKLVAEMNMRNIVNKVFESRSVDADDVYLEESETKKKQKATQAVLGDLPEPAQPLMPRQEPNDLMRFNEMMGKITPGVLPPNL